MTTEIVYSINGNESGAYVDTFSIENGSMNIRFHEKDEFDKFVKQVLQVNPYLPIYKKEFSEMDFINAESLEIRIPHECSMIVDIHI